MKTAEWVMLGALAGLAVLDLKTKRIPVVWVVLLGAATVIYRVIAGAGVWELAAGIVPGLLLLLVAFATGESIGSGDGLVLCALGLFCGVTMTVAVFGMALLLSAVLAIVLLVLRRAGRKTELPFLPCLCAGYLLCLLW